MERDEFVSCVDMHRALLTSQCATRAPVLTARVEDVRIAKGDEECAKNGGIFMVTLENVNNTTANAKQRLLYVGEIDIATGRGVPKSAFKDESSATGYKYGINETVYKQITGPKSSGFGLAPALIDNFQEFVFPPMRCIRSCYAKGRWDATDNHHRRWRSNGLECHLTCHVGQR